jgi:transposase-like protein
MGPTQASEKLAEEGYEVDHETLRRWLLASGDWAKQRRRAQYRQWRERKRHFGELVQMDGSHHRWFGQGYPEACLIELIDDATGYRRALLAEAETTEACMRLLWRWIEAHGIPQALYTDRKNVFVTDREPTLEEQLADQAPQT